MKPSAEEFGTFWVADVGDGAPLLCSARVETTFHEIGISELGNLQTAMAHPTPDVIRERLYTGRRCFGLKMAEQIVSYGWVSCEKESVGELEREFHLHHDEVYVWDCGTVPALRGQRCYSELLSRIIHHFHDEDVRKVWIGAGSQNRPSVQGIINAGFQHIIDMTYRRYGIFKLIRYVEAPNASPAHLSAAYHILDHNDLRFGNIAIGFGRGRKQ